MISLLLKKTKNEKNEKNLEKIRKNWKKMKKISKIEKNLQKWKKKMKKFFPKMKKIWQKFPFFVKKMTKIMIFDQKNDKKHDFWSKMTKKWYYQLLILNKNNKNQT